MFFYGSIFWDWKLFMITNTNWYIYKYKNRNIIHFKQLSSQNVDEITQLSKYDGQTCSMLAIPSNLLLPERRRGSVFIFHTVSFWWRTSHRRFKWTCEFLINRCLSSILQVKLVFSFVYKWCLSGQTLDDASKR